MIRLEILFPYVTLGEAYLTTGRLPASPFRTDDFREVDRFCLYPFRYEQGKATTSMTESMDLLMDARHSIIDGVEY